MKILPINPLLNSPSQLEGVSRSDEGVCGFVETSYHGVSEGVLGLVDREIRWKKK